MTLPGPAVAARLNETFAREARRGLEDRAEYDPSCTKPDPKPLRGPWSRANAPPEGHTDVEVVITADVEGGRVLDAHVHYSESTSSAMNPIDVQHGLHFTLPEGRSFGLEEAFSDGPTHRGRLMQLLQRGLKRWDIDTELREDEMFGLDFWMSERSFTFFNVVSGRANWVVTVEVPIDEIAPLLDPEGPLGAWAKP